MIRPAQKIIAVVPLFGPTNALGLPCSLEEPFGGTTVLGHTLARLARCRRLDRIVLVHSRDEATPALPEEHFVRSRVVALGVEGPVRDAAHHVRIAARRWSPTSWRGGLGGATCYDEVLTAAAALHAVQQLDATAALLVGGDWPLIDPALCDAVIERHLTQPDRLKLVFTQAPPGLAGCLVERSLLEDLAAKAARGSMIGSVLDYQPRRPQGDPIGKDPCVQTPPIVRNGIARATFDAPRWQLALRWLERECRGAGMMELDAAAIVPLLHHAIDQTSHWPQQASMELTTARLAGGPIVPQHHCDDLSRRPMDLPTAHQLFQQLGAAGDVAVTLGGLGDPLLHPQWSDFVHSAHGNHVAAIHLQTDLLVDQATLQALVDSPVDVISVNLNADTPETYQRLMGMDGFEQVLRNIEWLVNNRWPADRPRRGLPWIVPRFTKTAENVQELETFFDRWTLHCGQAIVESPTLGGGAMPDLAVLNMAPPRRFACRQLRHRMTVLSDGRAALCDQDWRGGCSVGDVAAAEVKQLWARVGEVRRQHDAGDYAAPLCAGCREWHRP